MNDQYEIEIQRPVRSRRGDPKLIVVVWDPQGKEVFRDRVDLNVQKLRIKAALSIANLTGDPVDDIADRLLEKLSQLPPPAPPANVAIASGGTNAQYPYEITPGGLIWNKETAEGIAIIPLTTFTATITGQVVEDDGAETRRLLEIEAILRQRTHRFKVAAGQFSSMAWPMEHLGAGAALWPGFGTKDHARAAIQFLSGDPPERRVYAHLGWREIGGVWCYLHANGAIGPVGPVPDIEVSLPPDLQRYLLPVPPTGTDLVDAIRASLELLEVAGDKLTVPVYCAIWRATLGDSDSGQHLVGHTGGGKTELAALAQQHYGADMGARQLPGSWISTDNALETLAFVAKDALLVVDDFCPTGSQYDIQAMHRKADRLFRGQGNAAGRGRLSRDGTLRATRPPRGMLLSTGEDIPRGQSLRARLMVQEMPQQGPNAMGWKKLTACQADAATGRYAQTMAGFLRWLAPKYGDLRRKLKDEINTLREQAYQNDQHRRTPNIVANLSVGLRYFLAFAQEAGALNQAQAETLWQRCWTALGDAAADQQEHQAGSDPVQRFVELLGAALSSGRAHLSDGVGNCPKQATAWGWQEVKVGTGDFTRADWRPQGEHIGWLENGDIYLQSDSVYAVVQKLARDGGDQIPVTLPTLKKRLKERDLLASTEKNLSGGREVERLEVRRVLQGKRRSVLHLNSSSLAYTPLESAPCAPSVPPPEDSYLDGATDGTQNGAQTGDGEGKVRHESAPPTVISVFEADGNGSDGTHGAQNTAIELLGSEIKHTQIAIPWEEEI
jgi:hypothetical protein